MAKDGFTRPVRPMQNKIVVAALSKKNIGHHVPSGQCNQPFWKKFENKRQRGR